MTQDGMTRFLGGSPGQVALRLVFLSFVVGVFLSAIDLYPLQLFNMVINFAERLWAMGFDAIGRVGHYLAVGAMIVVPIWLVTRLLSMKSR